MVVPLTATSWVLKPAGNSKLSVCAAAEAASAAAATMARPKTRTLKFLSILAALIVRKQNAMRVMARRCGLPEPT
jgi:hypothetical protein